jgi:hypothetical protein
MSTVPPKLARGLGLGKWQRWKRAMIEHDVNLLEQEDGNTTYRVERFSEFVENYDEYNEYLPYLKHYYIGSVFLGQELLHRFEIFD